MATTEHVVGILYRRVTKKSVLSPGVDADAPMIPYLRVKSLSHDTAVSYHTIVLSLYDGLSLVSVKSQS